MKATSSRFRGLLGIGSDIGGHPNLDQNGVRSVGRILLEAVELSVAKGTDQTGAALKAVYACGLQDLLSTYIWYRTELDEAREGCAVDF